MGTMIQRWTLGEADFRGDALRRPRPGPEGQQRHPGADPARRHRVHPRRLPGRRRRHHRDQHLQRHAHRPGRLRPGRRGLRPERRRRPGGAQGGRRLEREDARPPALRGGVDRPHQQDAVAVAQRERPRLPVGHLRRGPRGVRRAGARADGRRRRPAAGRDLHRHLEPEGDAGGDGGGVRREGTAAAGDAVHHHHRQERPHPVGADHRGVLHLDRTRPAAVGGGQLRPGRGRDASLRGRAVRSGHQLRQLLPERRAAQRLRRIRRDPRDHLRSGARVCRQRVPEHRRWLLRHHARTHRRHRPGGGGTAAAPAEAGRPPHPAPVGPGAPGGHARIELHHDRRADQRHRVQEVRPPDHQQRLRGGAGGGPRSGARRRQHPGRQHGRGDAGRGGGDDEVPATWWAASRRSAASR